MCDRAYTPAAIAELQRIASSEQRVHPDIIEMAARHNYALARSMVASYIAAQPVTEHRQLVAALLATMQRAGVDVELLQCAMDEQPAASDGAGSEGARERDEHEIIFDCC